MHGGRFCVGDCPQVVKVPVLKLLFRVGTVLVNSPAVTTHEVRPAESGALGDQPVRAAWAVWGKACAAGPRFDVRQATRADVPAKTVCGRPAGTGRRLGVAGPCETRIKPTTECFFAPVSVAANTHTRRRTTGRQLARVWRRRTSRVPSAGCKPRPGVAAAQRARIEPPHVWACAGEDRGRGRQRYLHAVFAAAMLRAAGSPPPPAPVGVSGTHGPSRRGAHAPRTCGRPLKTV